MVDFPYFNSEQRWRKIVKAFIISLLLFIVFSLCCYIIFNENGTRTNSSPPFISNSPASSSSSLSTNKERKERILNANGFKPCLKAPKDPQDRRTDHTRLSIVNYNCEWLFVTGGTGSIKCPGTKCPWLSFAAAQDHVTKIARVIEELDADIVNLIEIQDCSVLEMLMELLPSNHRYKPYLIKGDDRATGQNTGILTRIDPIEDLKRSKLKISYPIEGSTCKNQKNPGKSGLGKHYLAKFSIDNGQGKTINIAMMGAHLLAHPSDSRRCTRREAQALVLNKYLKEMTLSTDEMIIAGDFNDFDHDIESPSPYSNNNSSVMKIIKDTRSDLVNVASFIADKSERYSSWYDRNGNCQDNGDKEHELIDHIIVSKGLRVESAYFYHNYTMSCDPEKRISDHWPLKAVLSLV